MTRVHSVRPLIGVNGRAGRPAERQLPGVRRDRDRRRRHHRARLRADGDRLVRGRRRHERIEATPAFQQNAGGSFLELQRGVPDVALDADPNSGYDVIVGGEEEVIGGTSASAPSWQGIWARAQGAHGGSLGFAGPGDLLHRARIGVQRHHAGQQRAVCGHPRLGLRDRARYA